MTRIEELNEKLFNIALREELDIDAQLALSMELEQLEADAREVVISTLSAMSQDQFNVIAKAVMKELSNRYLKP